MAPRHCYKLFYLTVAVVTVGVDVFQIVLYLVAKLFDNSDPANSFLFNVASTAAQYSLFFCNCLCLKYFFHCQDFVAYSRKIVRHSLLYIFLVIFIIRFSDLFFLKRLASFYVIRGVYLVGVFVKHLSRLTILQVVCYYNFRSLEHPDAIEAWKFILYLSPNVIDLVFNIVRLLLLYASIIYYDDAAPLTMARLIVFVGEMLYLYYSCSLLGAFLLKIKNPNKDVLRFVHKESTGAIDQEMQRLPLANGSEMERGAESG